MDATPEEVNPGDVLTYTIHLTNTGQLHMTNLVITDTLPGGLIYMPGSAGNGQYDPRSRHLTWSLATLDVGAGATFRFQGRVRGDALDDFIVNRAEVLGEGLASPVQAQVSVGVTRHAVIPPQGGVLETPSGRLRMEFPPGAVDRPVRVRYAPRPLRTLDRFLARFDLTAWEDAADQVPVARFHTPVTLIFHYTTADMQSLNPTSLRISWFDEGHGQWVPLPSRVDTAQQTVTAQTDHFSLFGVAGTSGEPPQGMGFSYIQLTTVLGQPVTVLGSGSLVVSASV